MATTLSNEGESIIIVFDAALETARDYSAAVTSHPVETGVQISDHVTLENPKFTVKGVVSDAAFLSPFEQLASFANRTGAAVTGAIASTSIGASALKSLGIDVVAKESRSMTAYQNLQFMYNERDFVTLQFGDEPPYKNLILTKLGVPKDKNIGDAFIFDLEFEQVKVVSSKYTTVSAKRVATPEQENLAGKAEAATGGATEGVSGGFDSVRPEVVTPDITADASTSVTGAVSQGVTAASDSIVGGLIDSYNSLFQ